MGPIRLGQVLGRQKCLSNCTPDLLDSTEWIGANPPSSPAQCWESSAGSPELGAQCWEPSARTPVLGAQCSEPSGGTALTPHYVPADW